MTSNNENEIEIAYQQLADWPDQLMLGAGGRAEGLITFKTVQGEKEAEGRSLLGITPEDGLIYRL